MIKLYVKTNHINVQVSKEVLETVRQHVRIEQNVIVVNDRAIARIYHQGFGWYKIYGNIKQVHIILLGVNRVLKRYNSIPKGEKIIAAICNDRMTYYTLDANIEHVGESVPQVIPKKTKNKRQRPKRRNKPNVANPSVDRPNLNRLLEKYNK